MMRFPTTRSVLLLSVGLVIVLAACGSDSARTDAADPTEPPPASSSAALPSLAEPSSSAPAPASQVPAGEAGTFAVDGLEFAVTLLNRCTPFSDGPGNIDLQALATGAQLNLVQLGDVTEVSVQGPGIEAEFGSLAFGQDPVIDESSVTPDRWSGSATVGDSMGSGTTVALVWDVMIPAEIRDCSL
jgi:hypothetical protein